MKITSCLNTNPRIRDFDLKKLSLRPKQGKIYLLNPFLEFERHGVKRVNILLLLFSWTEFFNNISNFATTYFSRNWLRTVYYSRSTHTIIINKNLQITVFRNSRIHYTYFFKTEGSLNDRK